MRDKTSIALCCLLTAAFAAPAFAQTEPRGQIRQPATASVADPDKDIAAPLDSFGTIDQAVTWLPMAMFQQRHGQVTWAYSANGYVSRASGEPGALGYVWAPLTIPNGSVIDVVRAWISDTSATNDIGVFLTEYGGTADFTNDIGNASSTGTPGSTSIALSPNYTVDNSSNLYVVFLSMPIDSAVQSKGVRVLWRRQVSAAPLTATFGDVPTSHPFFRFIEALVAANITSGCGAGNYCPELAVTRGQMAVFLSVALGLHHPF